jgi:large repetitive protein
MRKIYLSILSLFFFLSISAQRVDYDNSSRWFLGLNLGGTWNSTDVKNKTATGFGFTLGKSYNYGYGKALSFDLRARYLRGFWYGQDADTTSLANYTGTALSSYKNSLGFTINNFQADVHRLAFELVIHGNGILESTGFDPYIFGGIGLTWAQTFGDLSNDFGSYAYDSLLQNNQLSSSDLENTLDGIYDSPLDGSSNRYMVNFMPSLGFGLGYQVGKRTTIGIEHKTTFTLADNFDGYASSLPRAKNDRYHYTSLYLQFRFKARESQVSDTSVNSSTNVNNYNSVCPSPIISVSNQTTTENNYQYELEATITNINKANEIIVTDQFGNSVPFTYLSNINRLRANMILIPGTNTFTITAQNNCGRDSKTITINFNPCRNPLISITNPSSRETTVASPNYVFTAIAQNITSQQGISLFVNNILQTNFTYNTISGQIQSNIYLTPGINTIRIDVLNNCGTSTASSAVIYNNCVTPQMQLISPSASGSTVSNNALNIKINLVGFKNINELSVLQNGVQVTNFSMNNNVLEIAAQLVIGLNTFTVNGTNLCGSDAISLAVTYQNCVSPIISLITPSTTISSTLNGNYRCRMKVENSLQDNIQLMLNNQQITNFTYNATTKIIDASLTLLPGNNTLILNASNPCGTDIETVYINNENCKSPTVVINGASNTTVLSPSYTLISVIQNINTAEEISVSQNGSLVNFDYTNGVVSCFSTLQPGINTFVVTAANGCGRDSKTFTITYNNCVSPQITLINPMASGITVANSNYNFQALLSNISNAQNISLLFNGINTAVNFQNGVVNAPLILVEGTNKIQLTVTNPCGTDNEVIIINYSLCKSPVITIQNPNTQITSTNSASATINGNVQNISSAQEISLLLNNVAVPVILSGNSFNAVLNFQPGMNTIKLTAKNTCGSDVFQTNITYNNCITPNITLSTAIAAIATSQQVAINAITQNISTEQQLSCMLNGISQPFRFSNNTISASLNLVNGLNTVVISATNNCGNDIETILTTFAPCLPALISISSPASAGLSVNSASFMYSAILTNVSNTQEISLTLNDVIQNNISFANGILSCNLSLQEGINSIVVQASTPCGRVSELTTVTYNNCIAPVVSTSISIGTVVSNASYNFIGQVQNVSNSEAISLTLNGQNINNFSFNAGQVLASVTLQPGINTFYLSGRNACGNNNNISVVNYDACISPVVSIIGSVPNNSSTQDGSLTLNAAITNYDNQTLVVITKNGTVISGYTNNNGQLSGTINLPLGTTTITVSATKPCGTDLQTYVVTRCKAPTVSLNMPNTIYTSVQTSTYFIQLNLANVDNISMVNATQNGSPITSLTLSNTILGGQVSLQPGLNTFIISVNTNCGVASATFQLNYSQESITPPDGQGNGSDNNSQKGSDQNKNEKPVAPAPVKPVKPAPVKPVTPEPVKPVTPKPVKPVTPKPVKPVTPKPVKPVTPKPVKPVTPEPVKPVTPKPVKPVVPDPPVPVEKKPEEKGGGK